MSENSFIKKIDSILFEQITTIRSLSLYTSFQELLSGLNDEIRDIVKYLISFVLIVIPIFFVLFMFFQNISLKNNLESHRKIYLQANQIIKEDKLFGQAGKSLISARAPSNQSGLNSKLGQLASAARIDSRKIKLQEYRSDQFSDKIQENFAEILFNDFTTTELSKFVTKLFFDQKAKINNIEIVRNDSKNLLEGKISILYLSSPEK